MLTATQLLVKRVTGAPYNFAYPATISAMHFLTTWVICVFYWTLCGRPEQCLPSSAGSVKLYMRRIVPTGSSIALSIICNNAAIVCIGAALNATVAAVTPVVTAVLCWCFGGKVSWTSWSGILIVFAGSFVIDFTILGNAVDSLRSTMLGLGLSLAAVFLRAAKVVVQDTLLNPTSYNSAEQIKSMDCLHIWALQGPICFALAVCIAIAYENPMRAWADLTTEIALLVLASCAAAAALNLIGMQVIKDLGANLMQIVGKLNCLLTLSLSVVFLHETIPVQVLVGAGIIIAGLVVFEAGVETGSVQNAECTPAEARPILRKFGKPQPPLAVC
eukprot:TRINITY_DN51298_c0_g1_i1.p1 TRINITY_DN51298_c0_g1~~TRINITY_DN51298_c0_g1_i1.p1  ORF type:complete len:331 (+),score=31.87 TRINITY_DN51298_c0_g1_i1:179-1171(+)